ncbi:MAG: hypothetical protein K6E95_01645 [Lachnospiraceae bacterium]|nr:hypothetical protein [Lachnospiraceae bacterium]
MKKTGIVFLLLILALAVVGCSSNKDEKTADNKSSENAVTNTSGKDEKAADSNVSENADTVENKKDGETDTETDGSKDETNLYQAFMDGTGSAKYTGSGDRTSYLDTKAVLEVGKSYTWDDISKALETVDEFSEVKQSGDVTYHMIDCGKDGILELYAEAPFNEEYTLYMIVKEFDGELQIIFTQDGWSRSSVLVGENGEVITGGSAGAAVHVSDYAYIDAEGKYKYYYGVTETLTLFGDYYAFTTGDDFVTIPTEGLDSEHIGIDDYYIEDENGGRVHYHHYFMIDDDFNDITTDADYSDDNEIKKRFADAGIKTYTSAEIDEILSTKGTELNIPDTMK